MFFGSKMMDVEILLEIWKKSYIEYVKFNLI